MTTFTPKDRADLERYNRMIHYAETRDILDIALRKTSELYDKVEVASITPSRNGRSVC